MRINGVNFDFNSTSLEGLELIEKAKEKMKNVKLDKALKEDNLVVIAKLKNESIKNFFSIITDVDIIKEETNPYLIQLFYEDFLKQCEEQRNALRDKYFVRKK